MGKRWAAMLACVVATLAVAPSARGDDEEQKANFWMKKKLEYTQAILTGLTDGDLDQVSKNARSMNTLGYLEKWIRANSSDYKTQLKIFQNANKQLIEMADEENLDGAALAYTQLTLSCVHCHKIVRDHPRAGPNPSSTK